MLCGVVLCCVVWWYLCGVVWCCVVLCSVVLCRLVICDVELYRTRHLRKISITVVERTEWWVVGVVWVSVGGWWV